MKKKNSPFKKEVGVGAGRVESLVSFPRSFWQYQDTKTAANPAKERTELDVLVDQNLLGLCSSLDLLVCRQHSLFFGEINLFDVWRGMQFSRFERRLQSRKNRDSVS